MELKISVLPERDSNNSYPKKVSFTISEDEVLLETDQGELVFKKSHIKRIAELLDA